MTALPAGAIRPRKPWVAVVLSLLATGLGHVYCGRIAKGIALLAISTGSLIAAILLQAHVAGTSGVAVSLMLLSSAVGLYAVVDAFLAARHAGPAYVLGPWNRTWVYALFVAAEALAPGVLMRGQLLQAYRMGSDAMCPTLVKGDHVLVVHLPARRRAGPSPGNVVAWRGPQSGRHNSIRRVVAVAGQSVEIRRGVVLVDGRPLPQTPLAADDPAAGLVPEGRVACWESAGRRCYRIALSADPNDRSDFPTTVVPTGHVFVLGDNRDDASDSRRFGPVPVADVRGPVRWLFWPARTWSRAGHIH